VSQDYVHRVKAALAAKIAQSQKLLIESDTGSSQKASSLAELALARQ
jgi:hypothetical protein